MPISQFAVSSALPRVRSPPDAQAGAQTSKADSQSRPLLNLSASYQQLSSQLTPSGGRYNVQRSPGATSRVTASISGPFLSEHRVLDSVTINCPLIAVQYTDAAAIPPLLYATLPTTHRSGPVGWALIAPACSCALYWLAAFACLVLTTSGSQKSVWTSSQPPTLEILGLQSSNE